MITIATIRDLFTNLNDKLIFGWTKHTLEKTGPVECQQNDNNLAQL